MRLSDHSPGADVLTSRAGTVPRPGPGPRQPIEKRETKETSPHQFAEPASSCCPSARLPTPRWSRGCPLDICRLLGFVSQDRSSTRSQCRRNVAKFGISRAAAQTSSHRPRRCELPRTLANMNCGSSTLMQAQKGTNLASLLPLCCFCKGGNLACEPDRL